MDLWLSQASQSSQLSPDNLHWPDLAPGSYPGTSLDMGPFGVSSKDSEQAQHDCSSGLILASWGQGSSNTCCTGL